MRTLVWRVGLVVVLLVLLALSASSASPPPASIRLLERPPGELAVGESYTMSIEVRSRDSFLMAVAMSDEYYPGRGIFFNGIDRAGQGTYALLSLTLTGKNSTADLPAVSDWPEPGQNWGPGVAPVSIAVGVRYGQGQIYAERFNFAVTVP